MLLLFVTDLAYTASKSLKATTTMINKKLQRLVAVLPPLGINLLLASCSLLGSHSCGTESMPAEVEIYVEHNARLKRIINTTGGWLDDALKYKMDSSSWIMADDISVMTNDSRKITAAKSLFLYDIMSTATIDRGYYSISIEFNIDSIIGHDSLVAIGHGGLNSFPPTHDDSISTTIMAQHQLDDEITSFCRNPLEIIIVTSRRDTIVLNDTLECHFKETTNTFSKNNTSNFNTTISFHDNFHEFVYSPI